MKEAVKMLVSRRNARAFNIRKPINAIRRIEGLKERKKPRGRLIRCRNGLHKIQRSIF